MRSRLALDAALLERERGDSAAFARRLRQSATLDESNKEAASLVAQYYAPQLTDPLGELNLQIKLLFPKKPKP